jgi:hypothetical protein
MEKRQKLSQLTYEAPAWRLSENPLDRVGVTAGISIEHSAVPSQDASVVCLYEQDGIGYLQRKRTSSSIWEIDVCCSVRLTERYLILLRKFGFWEMTNFTPDDEILDGEWYLLRAKETANNRTKSVTLFCPGSARDRRIYRLRSLMNVLLSGTPLLLKVRSWLNLMFY